jgi:hypothetical protein
LGSGGSALPKELEEAGKEENEAHQIHEANAQHAQANDLE